MEYLIVGTITKTIGLRGEVKVYPSTHFRDSRFKSGNHLFVSKPNSEEKRELIIKSHRKNGEFDNLIFEEISSIEEAEKIVHYDLLVIKDPSFLKKGYYYYSDLVGLNVYFDNGDYIGKIKKVEEYNSYATFRVSRENNKDVLIPFVKAFVKSVSLEENKVIVNYIEGLLWK